MIAVTRLSKDRLYVNPDRIEMLEGHPDTVMTLVGGEKIVVQETPEEIVERVQDYRRRLGRGASLAQVAPLVARSEGAAAGATNGSGQP